MITAFLEVGSLEYILLLVVFLVLVGIMLRLGRRQKAATRADELEKRYARLTRQTLDELPDGELVEAVVANLNAKCDPKDPDPYFVTATLSPERRAVYGVWVAVKELTGGTLEAFRRSPSARFAAPAIEGLTLIGAPACAMLLQKAMEADSPDELLADAFRDGIAQEDPLKLAAALIRQDPDAFTDEDETGPAD
ncbi:MAG: DMP19 family protein [Acutalibacteraceae bacterium]|jgi:hypothetical protein